MPQDKYIEIIDSVGIEVEFSNIDRNDKKVQKLLSQKLPGYKQVHDASCETPIATFANTGLRIDFEDDKDFSSLEQVCAPAIIGGEIVSPIRNSNGPHWVKEIYKLCELLWDLGEDDDSSRDSLHIHVNVSQEVPFFVILNLLRLTGTFEAILFRLGGMGKINRGVENNYCYMRPFLGNGPPVMKQNWDGERHTFPVFRFEELMETENKETFFDHYGDSRFHAGQRARYVVQRYMCVNFYPILTQGSFEFRTANKTLKPEYILAWTNFCKALVEKAYSTRDLESFENKMRPLHLNEEISEDDFLLALSYLGALDQDSIEVLTQIWVNSPTPKFDNVWRYTHLENYPTYTGEYSQYIPRGLARGTPVEGAEFIDVHQLNRNEQRVWANPQNIDIAPPMRIIGAGQIIVNQMGDAYNHTSIPMEVISDNYWIEYASRDDTIFFSIKRAGDNGRIFRLGILTYDDEGDEITFDGRMRDNGTYINLPFLVDQWENGIELNNLIPNMEEEDGE